MKLKCIISYDGTQFAGYQVQPNKRTVQGELNRALKKLHKGTDINVSASGRTDARVHAVGQVIHFESPLNIPADKWEVALNSLLPADVALTHAEIVPDAFHARYDARGKEYRYSILRSANRDPLKRNYVYHYPYPLDTTRMKTAIPYLTGTHDFTSFCSARSEVEDKVRELKSIELIEDGDMLTIRFIGTGFLYNMVRILTGTLLAIGAGDLSPDAIPGILEKKDRIFAGKTAPAQGLYLWEVFYE
ncbi:tRNA pseudouridine(38-40) synthase TruA [Cytobacillus purgationiresistens]|uniref:tRNA pseudouridine synthase A n=1 Tax=Cytobacillus purgationiresistens TaxID=863449 RepID=A0ABU0AMX5_9BACI|nr:tRNA pseudouridine(38-40) synthase TruA [Cytobacillus purgationiresistens]MDQ0272611.1 tRNA pseudouridine38-40 synthase [Cytobacillus purgationiresistens]